MKNIHFIFSHLDLLVDENLCFFDSLYLGNIQSNGKNVMLYSLQQLIFFFFFYYVISTSFITHKN